MSLTNAMLVKASLAGIALVAGGVGAFNYAQTGCPLRTGCGTDTANVTMTATTESDCSLGGCSDKAEAEVLAVATTEEASSCCPLTGGKAAAIATVAMEEGDCEKACDEAKACDTEKACDAPCDAPCSDAAISTVSLDEAGDCEKACDTETSCDTPCESEVTDAAISTVSLESSEADCEKACDEAKTCSESEALAANDG